MSTAHTPATLLLPFLPMLPVQILLNKLLYDISEIAIPVDRVDESDLKRPRVWDLHEMRRFMLVFGVGSWKTGTGRTFRSSRLRMGGSSG